MARPVQWLRELPALRRKVAEGRTETFARRDIERLFAIGRVQAQALMKAAGQIQAVAGAHFVDRASLLQLLDELGQAPKPELLLRDRILGAEPAPRPRPLRVRLPAELGTAMLPELPGNIRLSPGRLEIEAPTVQALLEALCTLAFVMQNDQRWEELFEPPPAPPPTEEDELEDWLQELRARHAGPGEAADPERDPERGQD